MYLFRSVDNRGDTVDFYLSETRDRDASRRFLQTALANPDNRPPRVFSIDGNRSYRAAIRDCAMTVSLSRSVATDARGTETTASNQIIGTSSAGGEPCRERALSQPLECDCGHRSSANDQKGQVVGTLSTTGAPGLGIRRLLGLE
jgi:hypothetical protein